MSHETSFAWTLSRRTWWGHLALFASRRSFENLYTYLFGLFLLFDLVCNESRFRCVWFLSARWLRSVTLIPNLWCLLLFDSKVLYQRCEGRWVLLVLTLFLTIAIALPTGLVTALRWCGMPLAQTLLRTWLATEWWESLSLYLEIILALTCTWVLTWLRNLEILLVVGGVSLYYCWLSFTRLLTIGYHLLSWLLFRFIDLIFRKFLRDISFKSWQFTWLTRCRLCCSQVWMLKGLWSWHASFWAKS